MEIAALFFLIVLGAYEIGLILLLVAFIRSIGNLKRPEPINFLPLALVSLFFLALGNYILMGETRSYYFQFIIPVLLIFLIFLGKKQVSPFLIMLSIFINIVFVGVSKGIFYIIPFIGGGKRGVNLEFFKKVEDLNSLSDNSWMYIALYIITAGLLIAAVIAAKRFVSIKNVWYILMACSLLMIIGGVRDNIVYNSNSSLSRGKSAKTIFATIEKIPFLRGNEIWLANTNGSGESKIITPGDKVYSFAISKDSRFVAYITGGLDKQKNTFEARAVKIVDVTNSQEKTVPVSDSINYNIPMNWSDQNLLSFITSTQNPVIVERYGTHTYGESVSTHNVVNTQGQSLAKYYGYLPDNIWARSDLVLIKRSENLAGSALVYVSKGGTVEPKLAGNSGDVRLWEASDEVYFREGTDELIFQSNRGFEKKGVSIYLYSLNIATGKGQEFKLPSKVYIPTTFSPDMKYMISRRQAQSQSYISAVDGSENIPIPASKFFLSYYWLPASQQVVFESDGGIKIIDINGKITPLTKSSGDKIRASAY